MQAECSSFHKISPVGVLPCAPCTARGRTGNQVRTPLCAARKSWHPARSSLEIYPRGILLRDLKDFKTRAIELIVVACPAFWNGNFWSTAWVI